MSGSPDRVVQTSVVTPQRQSFAPRQVIESHGELHQHPVQYQKRIQRLGGGVIAELPAGYFGSFGPALLFHIALCTGSPAPGCAPAPA